MDDSHGFNELKQLHHTYCIPKDTGPTARPKKVGGQASMPNNYHGKR